MVTSDNGSSFTANLWQQMCKKLNIDIKFSALYRPQSQGMLEPQHRGLKDSLKAAIENWRTVKRNSWTFTRNSSNRSIFCNTSQIISGFCQRLVLLVTDKLINNMNYLFTVTDRERVKQHDNARPRKRKKKHSL